MARATRFAWAAAVGLAAAAPATAQTAGGTGGTTATSTVSGSTSGLNAATGNTQIAATPTITGVSDATTGMSTIQSNLSPTNALGGYYANPYFQGRPGAVTGSGPGGFGQPLANLSGTGATGVGGAGAARTGTTGVAGATGFGGTTGFGATTGVGGTATGPRTGAVGGATTGFGGTTGVGGAGGLRTGGGGIGGVGGAGGLGAGTGIRTGTLVVSPVGGVVSPVARPIAFTARLGFRRPEVAPAAVQANLQSVLTRSSALANPGGVEVAAAADGVVVLRGAVRDADEARLAEGMLRLTPGVRDVRNELRFPVGPTDAP